VSRTDNPTPNIDDGDLKKRIADEHKILQDKMDKIGGFRFTIKGWSVTAVIAASAVGTREGLLTGVMISTGLAIMLIFFFLFEFEQVRLSRIFGDRARMLEAHLNRIDRRAAGVAIPVPYMAHAVLLANRKGRRHASQPNDMGAHWNQLKNRLRNVWQISWKTHIYFYFVLIILAFLVTTVPRYRQVHGYWDALTVKIDPPPVLGPKPNGDRGSVR
jgi:hypothetical protein